MIRRHFLPIAALALTIAGSFALAAPASAGHPEVSIGATFPVGHGIVSLVFGQPAYRHDRYDRGYRYPAHGHSWESRPFYYRVDGSLHRHGRRHAPRCYTRGRHSYHHPSCPALHAYFNAYDVHPSRHWQDRSWSPDWAGYGWRQPQYRNVHRHRDDCYYDRRHRGDCDERCDRRRHMRDYDARYDRRDDRYERRDDRYERRDDRYDRDGGYDREDWRDRD